MKTKKIALINGIVGLVGGLLLLFGLMFILGTAAATGNEGATAFSILFLNALKIAIFILGIVGAVYYKDDSRVGVAPAVLMIVGGLVSLIPFLGWIGGIIAIIGGSLYLAALKKFTVQVL